MGQALNERQILSGKSFRQWNDKKLLWSRKKAEPLTLCLQ
jgi:hypothetical protein